MKYKPVVYAEKGGWKATVEDEAGEIVTSFGGLLTEELAQVVACSMVREISIAQGRHGSKLRAMILQANNMVEDLEEMGLYTAAEDAAQLRRQLESDLKIRTDLRT